MARRGPITMLFVAVVALGGTGCGLIGGSTGSQASFCTAVSDIERFRDTFDTFDPLDVPAALATFQRAHEEQAALRDLAPSTIRADFDTSIAYLADMVAGLDAIEPSYAGRPPIYDDLRPRVAEVEAASARIEQYVSTTCLPDNDDEPG